MKRLDKYCEDWYDVLKHFYLKSNWVADTTIAYKNAELKKQSLTKRKFVHTQLI